MSVYLQGSWFQSIHHQTDYNGPVEPTAPWVDQFVHSFHQVTVGQGSRSQQWSPDVGE